MGEIWRIGRKQNVEVRLKDWPIGTHRVISRGLKAIRFRGDSRGLQMNFWISCLKGSCVAM